MEETISLILHGCELARELQQNLQNYGPTNQPDMLFRSCNEINRVFASATERLASLFPDRLNRESSSGGVHQSDPSLQEWLIRRGLIQQQIVAGRTTTSDSGRGSPSTSSSQRARRRQDDGEKRTIRARAPPGGNVELPPDDNYTWRKYGQKEILGSIYPRAYYRCTHQKMYNCPAKKQVQRLDNDFHTFEVTYIGEHTCHKSSTAPSIPPPPPEITQDLAQAMVSQTPMPMGSWLSMDFNIGAGGPSGGGGGGPSGGAGGPSGGAGPSTSRYGKEVDYQGVADLADVMFNSGSSSSNSMDFIFPSVEDKWEQKDKKN